MKRLFITVFSTLLIAGACSETNAGGGDPKPQPKDHPQQNLMRAMELMDAAVPNYFQGANMTMARYYNPYTGIASGEKGSVWMYTASIEAVNAILHGLKAEKESGRPELYDANYVRYTELLAKLYENAGYYQGTFTLTSYTQTKEWTVYGVNRGAGIGSAEVEGVMNVYDDQQWLIRELIEAYKLTDNQQYLTQAEYLTEYVLDGWDCTLDGEGNQNGGIPWGPGYTTKHSCSNGPMVSPLVWLSELYKDKDDQITYRYIDIDKNRKTATMKKSDYYLEFAEAVYDYQKTHLLNPDLGVYDDMMGGCDNDCKIIYETVGGVEYRANTHLKDRVGPPITYNSGTMLSGAADLYRATSDNAYLEDMKKLSDASFAHFARLGVTHPGYYTFDISGFCPWFDGVLMRGYVDVHPSYSAVATYLDSFQRNLDYAYENHLYKGMLPTNLLVGWNRETGKNNTEGMFIFARVAEYAILARHALENAN